MFTDNEPASQPAQIEESQSEEVAKVSSFPELVLQHAEVLKKIIDLGPDGDPITHLESGEMDGVSYEVVFRTGKQQPVRIAKLTFPNGISGEVVFRPSWQADKQELLAKNNPAVAAIFPQIFVNHRGVLVIECIQGLEEKRTGEQYLSFVRDPERNRQLLEETFAMLDALFHTDISVSDLAPLSGHNVIFDINTEHYRFFDYDMMHDGEGKSAHEKMFRFLADKLFYEKAKNANFWIQFTQKYLQTHPEATFYHEGEVERAVKIKRLSSTEEAEGYPAERIVLPNNPDYSQYYRAVHWRGPYIQGPEDAWLPLLKTPYVRRSVTQIDPNFLSVCQTGDVEATAAFLEESEWKILLTYEKVLENE